ncbi:MAG: hypothetical protein HFF78_03330 [Oscillospiraceae bacterium]|nr:hypothetical protein [Oscillospiraceae bacterium]
MTRLFALALSLCLSLTLQAAPVREASPPPDFELVFAGEPVTMEAGRITFLLRNNTGADAQVLLIPRLERQDGDGGWEEVPFLERVGFCGMADPLPAEGRECTIEPFELWGVLEDGTYRLGYEVTGSDGVQTLVQGEFQFHVDLQICGYPLAED